MRGKKNQTNKMGRFTIRTRNALFGYLFILPWLAGFLLLTAYPFFYSVFLSMSSITITPKGIQGIWIGLANYAAIFTKDAAFPVILGESVISVVLSTPMIVVASMIVALLLNRKFMGRALFRALFFLPVIIISGPVMNELIANKAAQIVEPTKYIVYRFFEMLPKAVGSPVLYVFDNLVLILWFSGVQILIYIAGLQKIDASTYEAAHMDGASAWEVFWKIILPFIKPMALVNTIFTIVEMASFPNNKINTAIADNMFQMGKVYSYSAAKSWTYFLAVFILLGLAFLLFKEKKERVG